MPANICGFTFLKQMPKGLQAIINIPVRKKHYTKQHYMYESPGDETPLSESPVYETVTCITFFRPAVLQD